MVRLVLQAVYKEVRGLHQAAYVLALFTLGSQVLALVRDRMLAHQFGAGIELDLYYAAFRIPDLLYVIFAATLSVYVLIPFVAERIEATNATRARELLSQIFTLFVVAYVLLACAIAIFAPWIVKIVFPGFADQAPTLVMLIRILLLQPFFLGISSLYGVITQLGHRFILYAISPLIYNIGIILGLAFLYPVFGLSGIAFGVVVGAIGHVLIQLPFIIGSNLSPKFIRIHSWTEIGGVLAVSVPRALTLSLHQLVLLVLVGFASLMSTGSVAVFQFAFNLQSVPLAIIGVSYSVAAFPMLAQLHAEGKVEMFRRHILTALRHVIFWALPIMALLVVVRAQFVRVVLGTGAFDWDDTRLTAAVLALFVLSLLAQVVNLLIVRALYAVGNTRLPFYVTIFSSIGILASSFVLYICFNAFPVCRHALEILMRVDGVPGTEVLVLPLGYALALIVHSITLLIIGAPHLSFKARVLLPNLARSLVASLGAACAAYVTLNFFVEGLKQETLIGIFVQGLLAGFVGLSVAVLIYYVVKSPELLEVYRSFQRKLFKTDIVGPQDEDHLAV